MVTTSAAMSSVNEGNIKCLFPKTRHRGSITSFNVRKYVTYCFYRFFRHVVNVGSGALSGKILLKIIILILILVQVRLIKG